MDYFILGLWGTTLVVVCIILHKVNKVIKFIKESNKVFIQDIKDDLNYNTNTILDRIAEITGCINLAAGNICKILDIVDAKDKVFIKATDTLRSEQSVKTRKAKNSSHNKKVTTIHCNKHNAK